MTLLDTIDQPRPVFTDWSSDHRDLPVGGREHAVGYIRAIVARKVRSGAIDAGAADLAERDLWVTFRRSYDGIRGVLVHSDNEDLGRALLVL